MQPTINKLFAFTTLVFILHKGHAQTNSLSSSPYSLYGLGLDNEISTGKTNSLGGLGLAMPSDSFINNSNPASMAHIPLNSFFFDFGFKAQSNNLSEGNDNNSNLISNFSNISIAFPISKKSGLSLTLIPFTQVGYSIADLESDIEGSSTATYTTDINGSGGINDLKLNYGYALTDKLSLGITGSALFGTINQTETSYLPYNTLEIETENYYAGVQAGLGFQYKILPSTSIGGTVTFPTRLNGSKTNNVVLSNTSTSTTIEDDTESHLKDFEIPFEFGLGVQTAFKKHFTLNIDYKHNLWGNTNQTDKIGQYVNQDFISMGLQFANEKKPAHFFNNLEYRLGLNYNTGNLQIDRERITKKSVNLGIGIPLNNETNSMVNIGYTYGSQGRISSGLIKDNYHLFSINLSLEGIWFQKRKIF
ncbi:MAG: hypothetical protein ACK5NB_01855 [Flavobacteriaceae bacterium]